jgi:acyl carrier protein
MESNAKVKLREMLKGILEARGDHKDLADSDSLFVKGRLDSTSMVMLIMHLEESFQINFADVDFDADLIDSVNDIESFVDSQLAS